MSFVDLRFGQQSGGSHLLFGGELTSSTLHTNATFIATLPSLRFNAIVLPLANITLHTTLPALEITCEGDYQSHAVRPVVGCHTSDWQLTKNLKSGVQDHQDKTVINHAYSAQSWDPAAACLADFRDFHAGDLLISRLVITSSYQQPMTTSPGDIRVGYEDAIRLSMTRLIDYKDAQYDVWISLSLGHQDGWHGHRNSSQSTYTQAIPHSGVRQFEAIQAATGSNIPWITYWQPSMLPPPGVHSSNPEITPATQECYSPSSALLFSISTTSDADLLFICDHHNERAPEHESVIVPVRRLYFVINNVTLHRIADGLEVPVFTLSLSFDVSSWTCGFEATLPTRAESLIDTGLHGGPVELMATINGIPFRLIAENINRERSFSESTIKISGRGRNAVLGSPYAPVLSFNNTEPRTAQQLMDDILTINGVSLGWSVNWNLTDWNIPAGLFAKQGTWIDALTSITSAVGGYLLPHRTEQTLKALPLYPSVPWTWDTVTPDIVLPADIIARESIRWIDKPLYNRVFISGQEVGVLGQVTRTGTAGNNLAPMVVDPLITETAAARQRGIAILSDTGRQIEMSLRLPILTETGIIEPGAFIEYQDGNVTRLGLVRSTRIDAGWPDVWQTLGVQCHA